ncbi:alpha-N-methyltransferase NTM1 [Xylaria sp. CBS 124048]|nr:alpha-N-methyltransferase NTM1 [Xylaria sp. CBS 124048]
MASTHDPENTAAGDEDPALATPDSRIDANISRRYWEDADATDNGMLGGWAFVSRMDLRGSRSFLAKLGFGRKGGRKTLGRVLEGGAGIGRITTGLLLDLAETVDVIEPVAKFTKALAEHEGVGKIFNVGLEDWRPDESGDVRYDVIWNQWCVGYLNDAQLESYLSHCKSVLTVNDDGEVKGVIVVKDNISLNKEIFDEKDSSVIRQEDTFRRIFENAGLRIIRSELQHGMPDELFPIRTFALKPK